MKTLKVLSEDKGQTLILRFIGSIDEDAALNKVKVETGKKVVMDVGEVDSINSCGGREWVKWIKTIDSKINMNFINCGAVFLDYANMIDGFIPINGAIESFKVPYYCEACDHLTIRKFESRDVKTNGGEISSTIPCEKCNKDAEVDVIVPHFLKFLNKTKKSRVEDV